MENGFRGSKLELRGSRKDHRVGSLSCRRVHSAALYSRRCRISGNETGRRGSAYATCARRARARWG
eukprot:14748475-Alexandrium_andersonii.AAC.1